MRKVGDSEAYVQGGHAKEVGMVPLPKSSMETQSTEGTVGIAGWREVCDVAAEAWLQTEIELVLNKEVHKISCSASESNLLDLCGL